MPYAKSLIPELGPLAAYGEYTEEISSPQYRGQETSRRSPFIPQNHLSDDTASPYLNMHSHDPVGWYTWGDEAFRAAMSEDRPLFLSVGYSSNHWCSVMGRDCWSDNEVADIINSICIPVLCDAEQYPVLADLLTIICRAQNGSSGYPLNVFLDAGQSQPFFITTWLPKRTIGQMPGITEILPRIKWLWTVQRNDIDRARQELSSLTREHLEKLSGYRHKSSGRIGKFTAYQALDDIRSIFDIRWGGFGSSPKFPEPDKLTFLLRQCDDESGASKNDKLDAQTMTDITLRRMWRGGIHDHLGGGFSVCSSDIQWLVPHFEKLLCVNALLLLNASMSQRVMPNSFHRLFAEDIIFSLTKDFADDGAYSQGFRSAIDGDTQEGEGRYYLWNESEIKQLLPGVDGGLFCAAYAVLPSGNFGSELAGSQMSWNILYEASSVTELARRYGMKGGEVASRLYNARKILLDYRDKRYPLKTDAKILMSWNGLTIGALAHASVSFETKEWLDMAERTALFITKNFRDKSGSWSHVWINGKANTPANADDLAYFLWGIVELYKAAKHFEAGEKQIADWLDTAKSVADTMIETFGDTQGGGLFSTAGNVLGIRLKTAEDMNSLPSANAVAAIALSELAFMAEDRKYSDFSRGIIGCFSRYVRENPLSCLTMITADMLWKQFKPKKKPEPEPVPIPTDEELNREEVPEQPEIMQEERKSRVSRRSQHQQTSQQGRSERASRRTARPHRTREK